MIELLINKHTRLPIAAKPAGSPCLPDGGRRAWTARELDGPNLCVVTLEDPPAELATAVGRRGVGANPFAEYETDPTTKLPAMVRQSTIEFRAADVRPGASVRLADMETPVG